MATWPATVGLTVPSLKFDRRAELARKTWEIAHASEPTIAVPPDPATPWNDDVCPSDPSESYFDVQGTDFPAGGTVNISTDWANYGSTTAARDGSFNAEEPVGEVPNADHTRYGVYAGRRQPASSSMPMSAYTRRTQRSG